MSNYLILLFAVALSISACRPSTDKAEGIKTDAKIKEEAEKYFSASDFNPSSNLILVYNNVMMVNYYENDSLKVSFDEDDDKKQVFKSFYYTRHDTIIIDGAFGLFGGEGFSIHLVNNKATLFLMVASDEFATYAYQEDDPLTDKLEVPCTDTKIILSEIPSMDKNVTIYGYCEFKSNDYYSSRGFADGHEILPRVKQRAEFSIYFKSNKLAL